ncbi:MAG: glycosyltransferase [Calothrix sp. C42_A2020_038]|nr:glycosyltransferase [Calothrix sp. C42_A2020_038]
MRMSFLFLGANSPWVYGLAEALGQNYHTYAVEFYDWQTYKLLKPAWSSRNPPELLRRIFRVMPTGYAGKLEVLFRFYLQHLIKYWCQQIYMLSGEQPWVIASYPYLAPWLRPVPSEKLIYYNFDDYLLYRPERKQQIQKQETELIERAAITLCASWSQTTAFQKRYPHMLDLIHHFPHGFVDTYLNPQPEKSPQPMTIGYVGNLGNRLDWQLIYQVAQSCPDVTFMFVGGRDGTLNNTDWQQQREAVLALANVHHVGRVLPDQVAQYYWSFAVNWIPYLVEHSFNQAACPTKIMDGIASGRPVISTAIPECRLYPEWIHIFDSVESAILLIREQLALLEKPGNYTKNSQQLEFARQHTWQNRAQTLEKFLMASNK